MAFLEAEERARLEARFAALSTELQARGAEAELCLVGATVVVLCFDPDPGTRRLRALFVPTRIAHDAAAAVGERLGLGTDWFTDAARRLLSETTDSFVDLPNLRVFAARGDYVLTMKCASLEVEERNGDARAADADLRYLLRYLDLSTPADARAMLHRYLVPRHLPDDLDERLEELLG